MQNTLPGHLCLCSPALERKQSKGKDELQTLTVLKQLSTPLVEWRYSLGHLISHVDVGNKSDRCVGELFTMSDNSAFK